MAMSASRLRSGRVVSAATALAVIASTWVAGCSSETPAPAAQREPGASMDVDGHEASLSSGITCDKTPGNEHVVLKGSDEGQADFFTASVSDGDSPKIVHVLMGVGLRENQTDGVSVSYSDDGTGKGTADGEHAQVAKDGKSYTFTGQVTLADGQGKLTGKLGNFELKVTCP